MRKIFFAVVILFSIYQPVRAEPPAGDRYYFDGETLTELCRSFMRSEKPATVPRITKEILVDYRDGGKCQGYVAGIYDSASLEGLFVSKAICAPINLNLNSPTEVVAIFLDQNPALRNQSGYELVMQAFARSFPCPK
jgi:Rap1a immunity proteins